MLEAAIKKRFPARGESRAFILDVEFSVTESPLVIFGPSGSGKSLTFQCIAGLIRPDTGSIALNGGTLFDSAKGVCLAARKRGVGYLFQEYALFSHLSVRENIGFAKAGIFDGRLSPIARREVDDFIERFELGAVADCRPTAISGGQRQRTALARALFTKPRLLLLDEPFSALDPLLRGRMRAQVTKILSESGIPALIITHDPSDVEAFAQSLLLYERGRVIRALGRAEFAAEGGVKQEILYGVYADSPDAESKEEKCG